MGSGNVWVLEEANWLHFTYLFIPWYYHKTIAREGKDVESATKRQNTIAKGPTRTWHKCIEGSRLAVN